MKRAVLKYGCEGPRGVAEVELPIGAKIVHFAQQHGVLRFWAEVDTEADTEVRKFQVFGTGHHIYHDKFDHVMSWVGPDFVWHLYELVEKKNV